MKLLKSISPYLVIVGIIVLFGLVITSLINPPEITYTEFMRELNADNIEKVDLEDNTATVVLKETSSSDQEMKAGKYMLNIKSYENFDQMMLSELQNGSTIEYKAVVKKIPFIVSILPYILLVVLFFIFMYVMLGQGQGGGGKVMNFGKSRARLYTTSKITFADVAGAEEEKEEMMELVSFLKNPKRYSMLGARIPKGVLMVGPPGTGKTYLAKAVAGEAGVPFFSISGSDFVEMYVGVGASRVRDLFEQAKKNSPCIVFIDEIDAVGRHRGAGLGGGHDEREQTLNQLLVEMDGFGMNEGVIVIAATNRPDILDPALTRPGRFDRKIVVGYPDIKAREEILKVHAKNKPLQENVNLSDVAKITSGFTAADLENLLNEAALLAARDRQEAIGPQQIKEATFRVIVGPEKKSRVVTEHARRLTAYHEAGHAVVIHQLPSQDPVHQITIIPRGPAGGMTISLPNEDRAYQSRKELEERIAVCLGGRVAEQVVLGDISTGASSDIQKASQIARAMVTKYGMSEKLGTIAYGNESDEIFIGRTMAQARTYSEEVAGQIDQEVKDIIDRAYRRCEEILSGCRKELELTARYLLDHETMDGAVFAKVFTYPGAEEFTAYAESPT